MLRWVCLHDYSPRMSALGFRIMKHASGSFHVRGVAPFTLIFHKILNLTVILLKSEMIDIWGWQGRDIFLLR